MCDFPLLLFSCQVISYSLQPHGLQHARFPCPSLSPEVCWNSNPLNQWCYLTISSSVTLFSSCPQSFPESETFPMSQFFASSGQRIQHPSISASAFISFRIDRFDLPAVQGTRKGLLQHHNLKASILQCPAFFMVQLSHLYMTTGKTTALTIWTFAGKVMSLLFNMLLDLS